MKRFKRFSLVSLFIIFTIVTSGYIANYINNFLITQYIISGAIISTLSYVILFTICINAIAMSALVIREYFQKSN